MEKATINLGLITESLSAPPFILRNSDTMYLSYHPLVGPVARGAIASPKFLVYLVVLCFEWRCRKPSTVARLQSKYLASPKLLGWLRYCLVLLFPRVLYVIAAETAFLSHMYVFFYLSVLIKFVLQSCLNDWRIANITVRWLCRLRQCDDYVVTMTMSLRWLCRLRLKCFVAWSDSSCWNWTAPLFPFQQDIWTCAYK